MEMALQAMDQVIQAGSTAQSPPGKTGKAGKSSQDSQDFGGMVRQKQQQKQETAKSAQKSSQSSGDVRKPQAEAQDTDTPREEEIPAEQYVLAAALVMQPLLELVTANILPQEALKDVEIAPVFLPEVQIEAVSDLPVERPAEDNGQALLQQEDQEEQTQFQFTAEDTPQFMDRPVEEQREERPEDTVQTEDTQWEAPVFGYMEATPVKVASTPDRPIELEAEDGIEQLGLRMEPYVTGEDGVSRVEFTLEPASLGKVTVQIVHEADGTLHIQMNAATQKAAELLQRGSGHLEQLLMTDTRPDVRIEVRNTQDPQALYYMDPNGSGQDRQQRGQQHRQNQNQDRRHPRDFLQQLRLGLVELSNAG